MNDTIITLIYCQNLPQKIYIHLLENLKARPLFAPLLQLVGHIAVPVLGNEQRHSLAGLAIPTRTSHTMDVGFYVIREVVDEDQTHLEVPLKNR